MMLEYCFKINGNMRVSTHADSLERALSRINAMHPRHLELIETKPSSHGAIVEIRDRSWLEGKPHQSVSIPKSVLTYADAINTEIANVSS